MKISVFFVSFGIEIEIKLDFVCFSQKNIRRLKQKYVVFSYLLMKFMRVCWFVSFLGITKYIVFFKKYILAIGFLSTAKKF